MVYPVERIPCNIYHPFIDDDFSLWGMDNSILKRSADYAESWETVFDFSTLGNGVGQPSVYGNVYISKTGYIFVGLKDADGEEGYLYRSTTPRVLRSANSTLQFQLIMRFHKGGFPNCWTITEDREGVIYIGEYGHKFTGSADELGNEIPIGYIYKSNDNGLNFSTIDYFVTTHNARHIHVMQVNPYTNNLHVTWGDWRKKDYISTDKGENFTFLYGAPETPNENGGHTGVGFFPDSIVYATDWTGAVGYDGSKTLYGLINKFRKSNSDGTNYVTKLVLDDSDETYKYNNACYDLHTLDETRAVALLHDEFDSHLDKCSSIWLTEDSGETWTLIAEDKIGSKEPVWMGLAHGRNHRIPKGFPYLIINAHWTRDGANGATPAYPREGQMYLGRMLIRREPVTGISIPNNLPLRLNTAKSQYDFASLPIYPDITCTTPDNSIGTLIKGQINTITKYIHNNITKEVKTFLRLTIDGVNYDSAPQILQPDESAEFTVNADIADVTENSAVSLYAVTKAVN